MAQHDTSSSGHPTTTRFCGNCGAALTGQPFCSSCGAAAEPDARTERLDPFEGHQTKARGVADQVRSGYIPSPDEIFEQEPREPTKRNLVIAAAFAALALVIAAVVLALTVFSGSGDSGSSYTQKLTAALAPVTRANHAVSSELGRLRGSESSSAQRAVANAQTATAAARGALGALTVSSDSRQLASAARQALDRESSYLAGLAAVLQHPSSTAAAQMQGLAGNLTSALDAVGDPVAGASQSVSGADAVVAWARHANQHAAPGGGQSQQPSGNGGGSSSPNPVGTGRDCGGGLSAGPNTTCAFAENVRQAYDEAPGASATVQVYSPVTNQTYTMNCSLAGSGVTCSGGNNASVSW